MNRRRRVGVYVGPSDVCRVVAYDLSTDGVGLVSDRIALLRAPSDDDLGAAVLDALDHAGRVVPHPPQSERAARTRTFIARMGYPSHRRLMAENQLVLLQRDAEAVTVTPTDNLGVKGGYAHREDRARTVPADPHSVGRAVRDSAAARDTQ